MNQDLKEIESIIAQHYEGDNLPNETIIKIDTIVRDSKNLGMTPITPGPTVREACDWELEQLAVTCALEKCHRNDFLPTQEEVQEERDFLSQAGVSVIDGYMTDSPGYCGPVYCVVWSGGPEIVTTYIIEKGRIVPAQEVKPDTKEGN